MKVFLDLDGVLVDFVLAMCEAHNRDNPYIDTDEHLGNFMIEECWGMQTSEFWKPANTSDFWANLPWMPDGQEIFRYVTREVGILNVCLLTSAYSPASFHGKVRWVQKNLPEMRHQMLIGSAKYFCAEPEAILVDDADHNIDAFVRAGGNGVLVPRPWNRDHSLSWSNDMTVPELVIDRLFWAKHDIMCGKHFSDAC